jgi:allantoin racemase
MARSRQIMFLNQAPKNPGYEIDEIEALLNSYATPGTKIEVAFPDEYEGSDVREKMSDQSAMNGLHHMMETPSIVRKIFWAAQNGYDAVIGSNTFDPGIDGGRLAVDIPVLGPFRTTMHAATTLADKVGITVPVEGHVKYVWRLLRTMGMDRFVTDVRPIGVYGKGMKARKAELFGVTERLINGLVRDGAEIIVPLGGALIPYVVDPDDLAAATGAQVLNTKAITIRFAELCIDMKMTQSAITYPRAKLNYADFTNKL